MKNTIVALILFYSLNLIAQVPDRADIFYQCNGDFVNFWVERHDEPFSPDVGQVWFILNGHRILSDSIFMKLRRDLGFFNENGFDSIYAEIEVGLVNGLPSYVSETEVLVFDENQCNCGGRLVIDKPVVCKDSLFNIQSNIGCQVHTYWWQIYLEELDKWTWLSDFTGHQLTSSIPEPGIYDIRLQASTALNVNELIDVVQVEVVECGCVPDTLKLVQVDTFRKVDTLYTEVIKRDTVNDPRLIQALNTCEAGLEKLNGLLKGSKAQLSQVRLERDLLSDSLGLVKSKLNDCKAREEEDERENENLKSLVLELLDSIEFWKRNIVRDTHTIVRQEDVCYEWSFFEKLKVPFTVSVYPSPSYVGQDVIIEVKANSERNIKFLVTNVLGQEIREWSGGVGVYFLENLSPGIYFIYFIIEGEEKDDVITKKIVVKRL